MDGIQSRPATEGQVAVLLLTSSPGQEYGSATVSTDSHRQEGSGVGEAGTDGLLPLLILDEHAHADYRDLSAAAS